MQFKYDVVIFLMYILSNIIIIFAWHKFLYACLKKINNRNMLYIIYVAYVVCINLIDIKTDNHFIIISVIVIFIFIATTCFDATWKRKITTTFYLFTLILMVETLVSNLFYLVDWTYKNPRRLSIAMLFSCIFILVFEQMVHNITVLRDCQKIPLRLFVAISVIPFGSIVVVFYVYGNVNCNIIVATLSSFFILFCNILLFSLYDDLVKQFNQAIRMSNLEQQNTYYMKQLEIMLKSQDNLRRYRHDSLTRIIVLQSMLKQNEVEQAKECLINLYEELDFRKNLVSTGNLNIDAILNNKIEKAQEQSVQLVPELTIPRELSIDVMDVSLLISNLIDNAITGVASMPEEKRKVILTMRFDRGILSIHIENPYNTMINYVNNRYITTKEDKENHGYGLSTIRNIVDKYNGLIDINHKDNIFDVDIIIYQK